jgi:hypothetical protein
MRRDCAVAPRSPQRRRALESRMANASLLRIITPVSPRTEKRVIEHGDRIMGNKNVFSLHVNVWGSCMGARRCIARILCVSRRPKSASLQIIVHLCEGQAGHAASSLTPRAKDIWRLTNSKLLDRPVKVECSGLSTTSIVFGQAARRSSRKRSASECPGGLTASGDATSRRLGMSGEAE